MNCVKCGKPATKRYSPDLDIRGIGSCDGCSDSVFMAYAVLMQGSRDGSENIGAQMIEEWQEELKKGDKRDE